MKSTVYTVLGALTLLAVTPAMAAEVQGNSVSLLNRVRVGVFYQLDPKTASELNINLLTLRQEMDLKENETILFRVEESGELNLSIYEDATYGTMRADGVISM